jgi:transposase
VESPLRGNSYGGFGGRAKETNRWKHRNRASTRSYPLRVGPKTPKPGKKKAQKHLLVACTERYTHYLVGDRDLATVQAFVLAELTGAVIVHDRYQNYDSAQLGTLTHQLCCAHLLRDLAAAAQVYPHALWPAQIAEALRGLIHQANLTREQGQDAIDPTITDELITQFRNGVLVGLSATTSHGTRPGERTTRLLLQCLHDREADVLRFVHDLKVPPTSNQAERDLRPAKVQQSISGRLTANNAPKTATPSADTSPPQPSTATT